MRILTFTTDIPPIGGLPTSGTALRTRGLVEGLRAHGHEVHVSAPQSAIEGMRHSLGSKSPELLAQYDLDLKELERLSFNTSNQGARIAEVQPDVILCGHWPALTVPSKPSQTVIIDLAGPHLLERHYQQSANQRGAIMAKLAVLSKADYFIVSGAKQRLYFLSFMLRAGIEQPESRIVEIPMPLSPKVPKAKQEVSKDFPHFIFGGVFLPWQNPAPALRTLDEFLKTENKGQLTLVGGKHPNYDIKEGVYSSLFSELEKNPRVRSLPMLPLADFNAKLQEADVALDLMSWNLERELAVTIRTTTYLWSGVPVIYNSFADLGKTIAAYDAGWLVDPADKAALQQTLLEISKSPELVLRKSQNASRLAQEVFSWDSAVLPLLDLLGKPGSNRGRETDIIFDFPDSAELPIYRDCTLEQTFICRVDGLNRVETRIATHNRPLSKPLLLSLFELDKAEVRNGKIKNSGVPRLIAREILPGHKVQNNEWSLLDFQVIPDSAGKAYMLRIESEEEDPATSASPWAVRGSPYPLLELHYGKKLLGHNAICLKTTCTALR